ncbi:hypothetical protein Tco_1266125 [Tanacetum coccineum]
MLIIFVSIIIINLDGFLKRGFLGGLVLSVTLCEKEGVKGVGPLQGQGAGLLARVSLLGEREEVKGRPPLAGVWGSVSSGECLHCKCFNDRRNNVFAVRLAVEGMLCNFISVEYANGDDEPTTTLSDLTERLKHWKNILQSNVEDRFPAVLKLEEECEVAPDHTIKLDREKKKDKKINESEEENKNTDVKEKKKKDKKKKEAEEENKNADVKVKKEDKKKKESEEEDENIDVKEKKKKDKKKKEPEEEDENTNAKQKKKRRKRTFIPFICVDRLPVVFFNVLQYRNIIALGFLVIDECCFQYQALFEKDLFENLQVVSYC